MDADDVGPARDRKGIQSVEIAMSVLLALEAGGGPMGLSQVWGDNGPVIVRWDYGAYSLPITVRVGATMPLLASAVGQVFLAYLPDTLTAPVLAAQHSADDPIPHSDAEIEQAKAVVRREGVAFTSGGLIPGLASVAAPVLTTAMSLPLVVAIALPKLRATAAVLAGVTADLLATTKAISAELGHVDDREHPRTVTHTFGTK